jgi:hypothetical protein
MSEFDPKLNVELFKKGVNVGKERGERYLNVIAYQYNGGEKKLRIQPANKNTNPNADANKTWINVHSISSITKDEAKGLIKLLEQAICKI